MGDVIAEHGGGNGEVKAFVIDDYIGFLKEGATEGILIVVCGAPQREVLRRLIDARIKLCELQVKASVRKCDVHGLPTLDIVTEEKADGCILRF